MDPAALENEIYIPVTVDAEREIDGEAMIRAAYFVVKSDAPAASWQLALPPLAPLRGVGAVGIAGVVYGALRQGNEAVEVDLFADPEDVASIFELEMGGAPLAVHFDDLWIPRSWISSAREWRPSGSYDPDTEPARGDVYRIALPVFQAAYRYTAGDIDTMALLEVDAAGQVFASRRETEALKAWSEKQIELTRLAFQNKTVKLRWREASDA